MSADAVRTFSEERLVRRESRAGAPWYELTHDRLIRPICQSNAKFRKVWSRRFFFSIGAFGATLIFTVAGYWQIGRQTHLENQCRIHGWVKDAADRRVIEATIHIDNLKSGIALQTIEKQREYFLSPRLDELTPKSVLVAHAEGYKDKKVAISAEQAEVLVNFDLERVGPTSTTVPAQIAAPIVEQRKSLAVEPPTEERIRRVLSAFKGDGEPLASLGEATQMLRFLGASALSMAGDSYVSAILGSGYEVTIWASTYGDPTKYGVRFGRPLPGRPYFGSNDTYFEISKASLR
jgi:hypothetical protein